MWVCVRGCVGVCEDMNRTEFTSTVYEIVRWVSNG